MGICFDADMFRQGIGIVRCGRRMQGNGVVSIGQQVHLEGAIAAAE